MKDKIRKSYRQSRNIYDDVLTRSNWWSRLYMDLFWDGVDDNEIARKVLSFIPDDFRGNMLDVPVGTGVFTAAKYAAMGLANITCLDYSSDMLDRARARFGNMGIGNVKLIQGDSRRTDWLMKRILSRKGWFTPPFETFESLRTRLESGYRLDEYRKEGSVVYFFVTKI